MAERKINQKALRNNGRKAKRVKGKQEAYRPHIGVVFSGGYGGASVGSVASDLRKATKAAVKVEKAAQKRKQKEFSAHIKAINKELKKLSKLDRKEANAVKHEWYMRERRAYSSWKSQMKKKGVIVPEMPDVVKNPTNKDISEMFTFRIEVQETYKRRLKEGNDEATALVDNILGIIEDAKRYSETSLDEVAPFVGYKAEKLTALIGYKLMHAKQTGDYREIKAWKKSIGNIIELLMKFLYDSDQSSQTEKGKITTLWDQIEQLIVGISSNVNNWSAI